MQRSRDRPRAGESPAPTSARRASPNSNSRSTSLSSPRGLFEFGLRVARGPAGVEADDQARIDRRVLVRAGAVADPATSRATHLPRSSCCHTTSVFDRRATDEHATALRLDGPANPHFEIALGRDRWIGKLTTTRPVVSAADRRQSRRAPSSLCLQSSTTVRLKLGSVSCGIDSRSAGASDRLFFMRAPLPADSGVQSADCAAAHRSRPFHRTPLQLITQRPVARRRRVPPPSPLPRMALVAMRDQVRPARWRFTGTPPGRCRSRRHDCPSTGRAARRSRRDVRSSGRKCTGARRAPPARPAHLSGTLRRHRVQLPH